MSGVQRDDLDALWESLSAAARDARQRRLQRLCLSLDIDALVGALIVDLLERIEELERGGR